MTVVKNDLNRIHLCAILEHAIIDIIQHFIEKQFTQSIQMCFQLCLLSKTVLDPNCIFNSLQLLGQVFRHLDHYNYAVKVFDICRDLARDTSHMGFMILTLEQLAIALRGN